MSITLLDGGMGQALLARSATPPSGLWSTQIMMDSPELVAEVHKDYFTAGADIATTNSYVIHHDRLKPYGAQDKFTALHKQACQIAVKARDDFGSGQVAGSLGPTGWSYRPDLSPPIDQAAELYAQIAQLHAPYVDIHLCETMSSVDQARGALMGAQVTGKPVWLAVSVDDNDGTKLRSGEAITDILTLINELKPQALLVNCATPEAVDQAIPLLKSASIPVGAYANGFTKITQDFKKRGSTVAALDKRTDLDPNSYADFANGWIGHGASIIGGCCEVGPEHIKVLARRFKL